MPQQAFWGCWLYCWLCHPFSLFFCFSKCSKRRVFTVQIQQSLRHLSPHFTAWSMWTLEGAMFPQTNNRVCLNWRVQRESAVSTIYSLASSFGTVRWWRWACLQSLEYCCPGCAFQSLSFQLALLSCWPLRAVLGLWSTAGALVCCALTSCSQLVHALFAVPHLPGPKLVQLWPEM